MLHEENIYPEPLRFNPDRYTDSSRNEKLKINPEPVQAFGFSRRICPGRFIALDMVWLTVASILSVYDISEPLNKDGSVIQLKPEYTSGLIRFLTALL